MRCSEDIKSYFNKYDVKKVTDGAYELLENIGILVPDLQIREFLKTSGFKISGDRVLISRENSLCFLKEIKARYGTRGYAPTTKIPYIMKEDYNRKENPTGEKLTCSNVVGKQFNSIISSYSPYFSCHQTGRIKRFDTQELIRMTRFIEAYNYDACYISTVLGYPCDVPPELEGLIKLKIAAENCITGWCLEPTSIITAKYMFEMAEILDKPINRLLVYMVSPLCLAGDSLNIVLEFKKKLESVYVFSMPSLGVTTPLSTSMAYAMALTEVLGGSFLVHKLTGLPVDFEVNIFPTDFHTLNMSFGSPEKLILELMLAHLNKQLFGQPPEVSSTNIMTCAKIPGIQAAVEKSTMMMDGALNGAERFFGIGALGVDEIFDPLQPVIDVETMKHISRDIKGIVMDELPEDFLKTVRKGLDKGFLSSDLRLDNHDNYIWYLSLFERDTFQMNLKHSKTELIQTAREIVSRYWNEDIKYRLVMKKAEHWILFMPELYRNYRRMISMVEMTSKERILNAFAGRDTDQIVWAPIIDRYYTSSLKSKGSNAGVIETLRLIDADIIERHVPAGDFIYKKGNIKQFTHEKDGETHNCFETPMGNIHSISCWKWGSETITKYFIETKEDIKVLQYLEEHKEFILDFKHLLKQQEIIGDDGIATVSATSTPLANLFEFYMGLENVIYMLCD